MLTIELNFPAGRYHATPWGRHVNEGVPEWPPSPYRLLRALYDTWRRKRPEWGPGRVEPLLAALAAELPSFRLPPASASHTRSFLSANTLDANDRKLVFDAFVAVSPRDGVLMGWPTVALFDDEVADLDDLLSLLNYLGRSEAWVSARVLRGVEVVAWNCRPTGQRGEEDDCETVPVACAIPQPRYALAPYATQPTRRGGSGAEVSWLDALAWGTDELLAKRMSHPPAFELASYQRNHRCFQVQPARRPARREPVVQGVLYALESKVLPPVTSTLEIAERVRRKLMGIHKRLVGDPEKVSAKFSGKDQEGRPLKGHLHAYILPLDQDGDGRLDHLAVFCRDPFDRTERVALDRLASLWQSGGRPDIRCIPLRWGRAEDFFASATRFTSATPFVPPRHYRKGRGEFGDWLVGEVRREAENHGLPAPSRVVPVVRLEGGVRPYRWIEFLRSRKGDAQVPGFGFAMEFDDPVNAPVALGYGAHFGLGLFVPA